MIKPRHIALILGNLVGMLTVYKFYTALGMPDSEASLYMWAVPAGMFAYMKLMEVL